MSSYGILVRSRTASPSSVRVELSDDEVILVAGSGEREAIPFASLYRRSDDKFQLRLRRRAARGWELRLSGEAGERLRGRLPARGRKLRWGAARAWHAGLFLGTLLLVELIKVPSEWLAPIVPKSLEQRLAPADLRGPYGSYCTSPDGERTLRRLITRFDPEVARKVKIEVLNETAFLVSSLPGDRLLIYTAFLTETSGDELAALLAHEVAHLQKGDPLRAALRSNGTLGALLGTVAGFRRAETLLEFSPEEEWAADREAIAMLLRANVSPLAGAALFERIEQERASNKSFGKEQYYLHYGAHSNRVKLWRELPDRTALLRTRPALSRDEEDNLFNYCWRHRGPPRNPIPPQRRSE